MIHVLLTIGLNELPALVAAYRLYAHYHHRGQLPIHIWALCSDDTNDGPGSKEEAGRVRLHLIRKLKQEKMISADEQLDWREVTVHEFRPGLIRARVRRILDQYRDQLFHLHHTGGTQAMGVHTMEALKDASFQYSQFRYEVSYLSPKEHCLFDGNDNVIDLTGGEDERGHWSMSGVELAELHGFRADAQAQPSAGESALGCSMLEVLKDAEKGRQFNAWLRKQVDRRFPPREWPATFPKRLVDEIQSFFAKPSDWDGPGARAWAFTQGRPLELFALESFRQAQASEEAIRIHSNVLCGRMGPASRPRFELDVVAVHGYELLVISCSLTEANAVIKGKGFEAVYRARQIGGSNARAIVLSMAPPNVTADVETTLIDDVGGRDKNVQVWGRADVVRLPEKFAEYLESIKWRKRT